MTEMQSRTQVLLDKDLDDNPRCCHGPMLRFSRENGQGKRTEFFGCSACRNRKECSGAIQGDEKHYQEDNLRVHREAYKILTTVGSLFMFKISNHFIEYNLFPEIM